MIRVVVLLVVGMAWLTPPAASRGKDEKAVLAAAVIEHLRGERPPDPGYGPDEQLVVDPGAFAREDDRLAERISILTSVRLARLEDVRVCPEAPTQAPRCRLGAARVFQLGEAEIGDVEATMEVVEWFSMPALRDPTPAIAREVVLRRRGTGWEVAEVRMLWRS